MPLDKPYYEETAISPTVSLLSQERYSPSPLNHVKYLTKKEHGLKMKKEKGGANILCSASHCAGATSEE
jgi:hypothetical protein